MGSKVNYFQSESRKTPTMNRNTTPSIIIHGAKNTNAIVPQPMLMKPNTFKTINTIVNNPKNPIPPEADAVATLLNYVVF